MFGELFENFGDDPRFRAVIEKMMDDIIIDINNDLKFNHKDVNDPLVGAIILILVRNKLSFEFLRTLNLCVNGADETALGNVNDFLNKLEALYTEGENVANEDKIKSYGE